MIEPLRSQYLAALGVVNYVPRFVLPGAKTSVAYEWLDPDAVALAETSAAVDTTETAAVTTSTLAEDLAVTETPPSFQARKPITDTANDRAPRDDAAVASPRSQADAGPQFALSMVLAAGGILLIDAAPASSAERSAFQKLLNNMLPALRPAATQYVLDIFIWPLTRQPKVPRDAAAACEALAAYLHKQIAQRAIDTVLLLGEEAQRWCALADTDVRVVKSSSLLACVHDPKLKRPLWNDIRYLAEG